VVSNEITVAFFIKMHYYFYVFYPRFAMVAGVKRNPPESHPFILQGKNNRGDLKLQLRLILDFLYQDIPHLDSMRFCENLYNILIFLYIDQVNGLEEIRGTCVDTPRNRKALMKIQGLMGNSLRRVLDESRGSMNEGAPSVVDDFKAYYEILVDRNRVAIHFAKSLIPFGMAGSFGLEERSSNNSGFTPDDEFVEKYFLANSKIDAGKYAFFESCYDPDIKASVQQKLISLLGCFQLDDIAVCPECNRCYLKTKKKRIPFCQKCTSLKNTLAWRKEHPEVYRIYQRNIKRGKKRRPRQIMKQLQKKGGKT
jgi:ribosomal protein L37AE/L43A